MTSCRLDKPDPLPTGTTCTVQLSPKHESGLTESDEPLTMATGAKDLYAIQVYKKGTINEVKYAYGIFDNEDDMQLELSTGTISFKLCWHRYIRLPRKFMKSSKWHPSP